MSLETSQRVPIIANLDPEVSGGGSVVRAKGAGTKNLLYSKYADGRPYAETRPPIISYAAAPLNYNGRGAHYWEIVGTTIVVQDDTIYAGAYGVVIGTISPGRDPVYFAQYSNTELYISDPENDQLWLVTNNGGIFVLTEHTSNLQPDLVNSGLTGGIVLLDTYIFLMSQDGKIYNSNVGDPHSWSDLDFIFTGRAVDTGVFLTKQQEHIVAISTTSIEFFYNAAALVGSPLARRPDIAYLTGAVDRKSVYSDNTVCYFIGSAISGSYSVYKLEGMRLDKVSHDTIDTWINSAILPTNGGVLMSGGSLGEHFIIYFTAIIGLEYTPGIPQYSAVYTAVYDSAVNHWGSFQTDLYDNPDPSGDTEGRFPVISLADRIGSGVLGQTIQFIDGTLAIYRAGSRSEDGAGTEAYVTEDGADDSLQEYLTAQSGYVEPIGVTLVVPIHVTLTTEQWDAGTYTNKFLNRFAVVGKARPARQDEDFISVRWSDDAYENYSAERQLSVLMDRKLTRLGKFKRRAFDIQYSGPNRLRIEALEADVGLSGYA